jgi:hypothetical protein
VTIRNVEMYIRLEESKKRKIIILKVYGRNKKIC